MTERPIIFSAPMVRAILAGRKTQTRRIVKGGYIPIVEECFRVNGKWVFDTLDYELTTPYGRDGDRLWVRERGWISPSKLAFIPFVCNESLSKPVSPNGEEYKVCPSIHMPRWCSRITLEITGIRVERLQDISEADAIAEGLKSVAKGLKTIGKDDLLFKWGIPDSDGLPGTDNTGWPWDEWEVDPRKAYKRLWESINGPGSWDSNPWVWVIVFPPFAGNVPGASAGGVKSEPSPEALRGFDTPSRDPLHIEKGGV